MYILSVYCKGGVRPDEGFKRAEHQICQTPDVDKKPYSHTYSFLFDFSRA